MRSCRRWCKPEPRASDWSAGGGIWNRRGSCHESLARKSRQARLGLSASGYCPSASPASWLGRCKRPTAGTTRHISILLSAGFLVASFARDGQFTINGVADALLSALGTYLVALVLFLPFTRSYELFYNGVDLSKAKTLPQHYLTCLGFSCSVLGSVMLTGIYRNRWYQVLGKEHRREDQWISQIRKKAQS